MDSNRNRLVVALSGAGAVLLLLGAFLVVWLMPREPGVGQAQSTKPPGQLADGNAAIARSQTGDAALVSGKASAAAFAPLSETPHISVNGTGIISAKPDMVTLQIGVQIQRDSLEAAQTEAATKIDAALNQLKGAGIDEKDISTSQYSVEPVMDYSNNQPPRLVGFRVTNILSVKIRDLANAGKLIDDQVKAGANTVYGLSFGFSDPTALMRQAREAAVNDAKTKAEQLAGLGGVGLGAPIAITDGGSSTPPVAYPAADMAETRAAGQVMTAIVPGQQEVRVEVNVVYAIK